MRHPAEQRARRLDDPAVVILEQVAPAQDLHRVDRELQVVLQTESPLGVENAEEIYRLPGCDAVFIGPNDLRFNMRTADGGEPTDEQHEALIQEVVRIGRKVGTPTGIHVMDPHSALKRAKQGMQFIAVGSDLRMLGAKCREYLDVIRPEEGDKELARY